MESDFATWLMREIETRGWTNAELARRAGISAASISMVVSGQKGVGLDFCLGVSRAFGQPPETVLRKAGLLPPIPTLVSTVQDKRRPGCARIGCLGFFAAVFPPKPVLVVTYEKP